MKKIPITIGFNDSAPAGFVEIGGHALPNLHEFVLSPSFQSENNHKKVLSYGLIHYTQLPPREQWLHMINEAGIKPDDINRPQLFIYPNTDQEAVALIEKLQLEFQL